MRNMRTRIMLLLPGLLLLLGDQWVKHWIRGNLPLYSSQPLLPGVVELTYVQNTGAAFSLLSEHTWLLTMVSAVASLGILYIMLRGIFPHLWGNLALSLVLGGAVGNLVDRATLGYVVDMFHLEFIDFAIFNVADMGVTVGGLLFCIYVVFIWKTPEAKASPPKVDGQEVG